ncbi:uncharacterized protein LOC118740561 [Rhagoletis pomonella]|uniref:uncharacterized protein LOC118740561 n=1 Tax=Rhagoletis pomonella TaxID=28610 RepID=UPI00178334E5|nr:uncharacterized protein LOC118740561 [Rhagoletis pomonella]
MLTSPIAYFRAHAAKQMRHTTHRVPYHSSTRAMYHTVASPILRPAAILILLAICRLTLTCPAEVCMCKWKGGKQTVECGSQQLPNIPEGMDPGTQVLNFSGNSLQVLQSERFLRMDLLNLQKIYLSRNQLIRIHEKAFRGLTNLVELDLSDNMLQNVPTETFQDYSSLMRLSLSGNPIRELKTSAFRHLSFLTTLELSNCQIERIENEAFIGMDNLEWLRLDGNRIGFIQGPHILPKSLHGISLQSNRWMCDCRLLDVYAWLKNYVTPQVEEPKCIEPPRLKGHTIKSLNKDDLACLPEVTPTSTYTEISEGRNMSIMCVVRAIPEPQVLWLFNGQVMTNESLIDNLHMYFYIDEGGSAEEKRSEIFIYNVGPEENGTFSCVGKNIAGITFSNYTLRVITKEPPVVNEVSFPRDYMNYIMASSTGAGVIFVVLLCTIVIKCKQRQPNKRQKFAGGGSVTNVVGGGSAHSTNTNGNETALMKCSSILNDGESMNGGAGLLMADAMTPTKMCKENGGVIIGGQMKQNLLLYAPAHYQQQTPTAATLAGDNTGKALQLSVSMAGASGTPPPILVGNAMSYCSPPSSVRNYQEKNPDLVNDAESGNHNKLKTASSLDGDYDAASDCSGPCSIQGMSTTPVPFDSCYQLAPHYGSQIIRPANMQLNSAAASRFAAMTTLPRVMQLKTVMNSLSAAPAPQHQVDVHLNPVCFLGQDGFAYDYSNAHMQQAAPPPPSHHHLQLQPQHSLGAEPSQSQHIQQQNYYRTLPHNRAHKQQQFAASAANPGMRYSLEAEFLQRSGTPTYDKYMPNVRFTAEGYPLAQQQQQQHLMQYPSPPDGYKSSQSPAPSMHDGSAGGCGASNGASTISTATFQQWPPCLPGYHVQAIRYSPTFVGVLSPQAHTQQPHIVQQQHKSTSTVALTPNGQTNQTQVPITTTCATFTTTSTNTGPTMSTSSSSAAVKRCVAAQADASTIPECDENDVSPTTSTAASSSNDGNSSSNSSSSSSSATTVTMSASNTTATTTATATATEESSKLRHLNGPLADSPDEGYVGDSHEGSDI